MYLNSFEKMKNIGEDICKKKKIKNDIIFDRAIQ